MGYKFVRFLQRNRKGVFKVDFEYTKNQWQKPKIDLELWLGLTQDSTMWYPQTLQQVFFDWSVDIFQSLIGYIKFSAETQGRLITAVYKICLKYTKCILVRLHPHHVTNWHYVTVG